MSEQSRSARGSRGTVRIVEPDRAHQVAARRVAEVKATVPDATYKAVGDARVLLKIANDDPAIGFVDVICSALARALREQQPEANAAYRDAQIEIYSRVNVAIYDRQTSSAQAVTIFDADTMTQAAIGVERRRLTERVLTGRITSPESRGSTCSIVDLSASAVDTFTPLLTPPHALALGIGRLSPYVVCDADNILRPSTKIELSLTTDARVLSPSQSGALLAAIVARIDPTSERDA